MPITGNTFTYTNPTGATGATPGQVVQSAVWDQIHTDLSNAINQVYAQVVAGVTLRNFMAANGSFEVWQRTNGGTSASISVAASTLAYTADRWYIQTGATQACTIAAATGLSTPSLIAGKVQRNNGQTGVTGIVFAYPFDTPEIARMRGNKLNFGMLAQTGANWSPTSGTFSVTLYYGTGAVGKRNATPYTNEAQGFTVSTNLAAGSAVTAISASTTVVIPATTTQMELQIAWTPTGTASTNDFITFDDVQLELVGSTLTWAPTNYDRIPFQLELELCKRFYQKTFEYATAPAQGASAVNALSAVSIATQRIVLYWEYPVELRTTPSITAYNPAGASANMELYSLGADFGASVATNINSTLGGTKAIVFYSTTSGGTTNTIAMLQAQADSSI